MLYSYNYFDKDGNTHDGGVVKSIQVSRGKKLVEIIRKNDEAVLFYYEKTIDSGVLSGSSIRIEAFFNDTGRIEAYFVGNDIANDEAIFVD